jgi:hypothetical protein
MNTSSQQLSTKNLIIVLIVGVIILAVIFIANSKSAETDGSVSDAPPNKPTVITIEEASPEVQ